MQTKAEWVQTWMKQLKPAMEQAHLALFEHPEFGFREHHATAYLLAQFRELGYEPVEFPGITGFSVDLDTGFPGPTVAVMAELDAIVCESHPSADPTTHAAHACGHSLQCGAMMGVASALRNPQMLEGLCGVIRLMVLPAEEHIEMEFRQELCDQGVITYKGGKTQLMARGLFDDVDVAVMFHSLDLDGDAYVCHHGMNGNLLKKVCFEGVAAHAAGSPECGINAMYAATLGAQAVNSLRETFVERDRVRVHGIMRKSGGAVNVIPSEAVMEYMVRASSLKAILEQNRKVNRAFAGAAAAMGAGLTITEEPGYAPLRIDKNLMAMGEEIISQLCPLEQIQPGSWMTASTDAGDVSCILPVIQPFFGGVTGSLHSRDFRVTEFDTACVLPATWLVLMVCKLLEQGGAEANRVKEAYAPEFPSARAYLDFVDTMAAHWQAVTYTDDGILIQYEAKTP